MISLCIIFMIRLVLICNSSEFIKMFKFNNNAFFFSAIHQLITFAKFDGRLAGQRLSTLHFISPQCLLPRFLPRVGPIY